MRELFSRGRGSLLRDIGVAQTHVRCAFLFFALPIGGKSVLLGSAAVRTLRAVESSPTRSPAFKPRFQLLRLVFHDDDVNEARDRRFTIGAAGWHPKTEDGRGGLDTLFSRREMIE